MLADKNRKSVKLFKRVLLGFSVAPSVVALTLPPEIWSPVTWVLRDLTIIGVAGFGCTCVSYDQINEKLTTFVIALWRVIVMAINIVVDFAPQDLGEGPQVVSLSVLGLMVISLYLILYRANSLRNLESCKVNNDEAFYVLIPIHDRWGLWQCLLMPWHFGRYQSRAVVQGDKCWHVTRRTYACRTGLSATKVASTHPGAVFIPLKRKLTQDELGKLDNIVGQKVIMGVRDCRRLMVAGHPREFV